MDKIMVFIKRMEKLGIKLTFSRNYPWLYLDTVNGNKIKEKYYSEHAFTIMLLPIRTDQESEFLDIGKLFEIIRKYK